jgi:MFS family permease
MTAHVITRRAVWSWITYDLANTMFSMGIVSLYFSLWVRAQVGSARADTLYGNISAISYLLIFIVSPLLGAMTDRARRRMPFLIVSTLLCVACTLLLGRIGFWPTMVAFIVANAAYQAGLQFYDAMLPEVSTEENRGRISGIGVGIGYLGSFAVIGMGFLTTDMVLRFTLVAIGFLVLALPCFLFVRERGNPHARPVLSLRMIRESTAQTWATLRSGRQYPGLLRFLLGRIFYTDAINTVIAFMGLYVVNVAVAAGRDGGGALVYTETPAGSIHQLRFRSIAADGQVNDAVRSLTTANQDVLDLALSAYSHGYVIAYRRLGGASDGAATIYLMFVDADGNFSGTRLVRSASNTGRGMKVMVANDGRLIVVWSDAESVTNATTQRTETELRVRAARLLCAL